MASTTTTNSQLLDSYSKSKAALDAKKKAAQAKAETKAYQSQIKQYEADNQSALTGIKDPEFQVKQLQKELKDLTTDPSTGKLYPTPWNSTLVSQYEINVRDTKAYQKQIDGYRSRIARNNNNIEVLTAKINKLTNKKPVVPPKGPDKLKYKYNAPMVKSAYFYPTGPQYSSTDGKHVDIGTYQDALQAWSSVTEGGRGTFQMDRVINTAAAIASAKKASKDPTHFDPQMYGFKFLYNPQTVNMSWGAIMGANPVFEAMGQDPAVPIAANLLQSTLSFDIILNRIEDMNFVRKDGSFMSSVPLTQEVEDIQFLVENTVNKNLPSQGFSPYPQDVDIADRKEIYNKGTMYDIEYLFRTMHGFDGFTNYTSGLMNKTNDPGWLPVRPVELHLGNKLRYRVRIVDLTVKHSIFNARMVPLLSTVSFTCARYWDGPTGTKAAK